MCASVSQLCLTVWDPIDLWNENIACHINKQEIAWLSVISGLQMYTRAPQNCDPADAGTPEGACWGAGGI